MLQFYAQILYSHLILESIELNDDNGAKWVQSLYVINTFLANVPISFPLKTPENLWLSGVFRGNEIRTVGRNGLIR